MRSYGLPAKYELHGVQWLKRRPGGEAEDMEGLRSWSMMVSCWLTVLVSP